MAKGLGRGIESLFPQMSEKEDEEKVQEVKLKQLRANPYQPRQTFSKETLDELAASIKQHGILQPLIVRKSIRGYEIVVGERRYRAARQAGLEAVPVVVKSLTDEEMMELALIENLQREDLNPVEEAIAYQKLLETLNITQEELAEKLGKSRPYIANYIRLLHLPKEVLDVVEAGKLSMGHGRALLGLKSSDDMIDLAQKVIDESLNVRQLEKLVQQLNKNVSRETLPKKKEPDLFIKDRENQLQEQFGTAVHIKRGKKKGKIEIEFLSDEDLERILELLSIQSN